MTQLKGLQSLDWNLGFAEEYDKALYSHAKYCSSPRIYLPIAIIAVSSPSKREMITTSSRDKKGTIPAAKQEASSGDGGKEKLLKAPLTTSSRHWSSAGLRNPRIVRVSRTFGGKDRHSKVCTVRGLRDRRIRLSVPTAVQLYELQDRLGLSQPSKVIDWLMDASKIDIDKLPPLQFPQGALLGQIHHQHLLHPDHHYHQDSMITAMKSNEQEKLFGMSPFTNYYHGSDHQASQGLSLSQLGLGQFSLPKMDGSSSHHNIVNNAPITSSSTLSSPSLFNSQLFFSGQPNSTASLFAPTYPQYTADPINHDHTARSASLMITNHNHHIQLLTSNASPSTSLSQNSHILPSYSLMSSLHNSGTANDTPNLIKSFPPIFNPRFLPQSIFGNRLEKDHN